VFDAQSLGSVGGALTLMSHDVKSHVNGFAIEISGGASQLRVKTR
jgi:hypothetical protein